MEICKLFYGTAERIKVVKLHNVKQKIIFMNSKYVDGGKMEMFNRISIVRVCAVKRPRFCKEYARKKVLS
jgi:hypothetical protein